MIPTAWLQEDDRGQQDDAGRTFDGHQKDDLIGRSAAGASS